MSETWSVLLKQYRLRHDLTQVHLANVLGIAPRIIARWERNQSEPDINRQRQLRDLTSEPCASLSSGLLRAISKSPLPRALSRMPNLRLQALSPLALQKRPSMSEWLGRDLAPIAEGVLAEMLDDTQLQRSIAKREIFCAITTTRSVLQTAETVRIGAYQTTISYFFDEGTLYSDAMSVPAPQDTEPGYRFISMDDIVGREPLHANIGAGPK